MRFEGFPLVSLLLRLRKKVLLPRSAVPASPGAEPKARAVAPRAEDIHLETRAAWLFSASPPRRKTADRVFRDQRAPTTHTTSY